MSKKLKIGIVTDQLLAGGVQLAAIEQVKQLNKMGHKAKLLILMRKKYSTDFSHLVKGIPYQFLSDSYPFIFRKTVKFPIFSFLSTLHLMSPILAPRVLKVDDYDILISLGTTTCLTTQAIYRKLKIPYIAVIHDPIVYILEKTYSNTFLKFLFPLLKPIARYFEHSFVKDARKTLIISQVHYDYIKNNYGITPQILGFGTKTLDIIPKQRGDYILSFGRWQKEKNPEFLLKIVKSIPDVKIVIAGNWIVQNELDNFINRIKKEKLTNRIKLIPHFENKELVTLCENARVFIHPHFEAYGLAALEAAGQGLPIIIPQKSGVTEKFHHRIHGYFPKKVALSEYKKYILELLKDERKAYSMGKSAYELVKRDFSWESHASNLENLLQEALGKNHAQNRPTIVVLETGHAISTMFAGGDKLMEPMTKRLSKKYDFTIIVPKIGAWHWENSKFIKELIIIPSNRFDVSGSPVSVFATYCIRMFQTIRMLIHRNNMDILYSSTNILPDVLPVFVSKMLGVKKPWIARIHHVIPLPFKREGKFIVNTVAYLMQIISLFMIRKKANAIIVLNQNLKNQLIANGFPEKKLTVIGAGIDYKFIRQQKGMSKQLSYDGIFLGRLHPSKGIFDLLPIWKSVVKVFPNAVLGVIGVGTRSIISELKHQLSLEGLTNNIILLGFLPDKNMYNAMKHAKFFLFTDHEAGWGLAVGEAMASGLPVVGYDTGVLGTVFKRGYRTIPLGNLGKFSKELIHLLQDENYRKKLSYEAISESSRHDWKITSNKFHRLIGKNILRQN